MSKTTECAEPRRTLVSGSSVIGAGTASGGAGQDQLAELPTADLYLEDSAFEIFLS